MQLLLVEDDPMIGESLEEGLRAENYDVRWVRNGPDALAALASAPGVPPFDLVLLDLGIPGLSGIDVLTRYRAGNGDAPVLIITARDAMTDRVRGLDAGADDYLIKPFDFDELYARIRALLRRRSGGIPGELRHRGLVVYPARHKAVLDGEPLKLSARQFAVLLVLMDPPGRVVSRARLEEKLYGWNDEIESNTVDVFIHHLRRKLGADFIRNVRGVGYVVGDDG